MSTEKVKGPTSCSPSIAKTCGQPVEHWKTLIDGQAGTKHMETMNWPEAEHGLGHRHSNALVAHAFAEAVR